MGNWLDEYYILMFGEDNSIDTYAKAAVLKFEHMPKHLYKYRTFCDSHKSALKRGVLYFSLTGSLNDVKEANICITAKAEIERLQRIYNEMRVIHGFPQTEITSWDQMIYIINDFYKQRAEINKGFDVLSQPEFQTFLKGVEDKRKEMIAKTIKDSRNMYSVCSFSASNDINQMWAHYSDSHQGFCIEYDFKSLGIDDMLTSLLFPVLYKDDNRVFINSYNEIDGNVGLAAATLKDRKEWGYEKEWRLVHGAKEHHTPQVMPKPTGIYLGENVKDENKKLMKEYCYENNIPLYQMKYNQQTNHFDSQKIEDT